MFQHELIEAQNAGEVACKYASGSWLKGGRVIVDRLVDRNVCRLHSLPTSWTDEESACAEIHAKGLRFCISRARY